MTVVNRPGHHDARPDGKANEKEGRSIGAHYTNNPAHKGASMTESYVNVVTGDYSRASEGPSPARGIGSGFTLGGPPWSATPGGGPRAW